MVSLKRYTRTEGFWFAVLAAVLWMLMVAVPTLFPHWFAEPTGRAPNQGNWFAPAVVAVGFIIGMRSARWFMLIVLPGFIIIGLARPSYPEFQLGWRLLSGLAAVTWLVLLTPQVRSYMANLSAYREDDHDQVHHHLTRT